MVKAQISSGSSSMSLTSHLKDKNSLVRQFILDRFPNTRALTKEASAAIKKSTTSRPNGSARIPTTIGGAIDYRIRYFFPQESSRSLLAWKGANQASTQIENGFDAIPEVSADARMNPEIGKSGTILHPAGGVVTEFFEELDSFLESEKPAGRQLDHKPETVLARYCYVLSLFEEVSRAGAWPTSILFKQKYKSSEELLEAISDDWVDDIVNLSAMFFHQFEYQLNKPVTLNPTFDGSIDVSGADGDLILDHCLIDFKATINPKLSPDWIPQLVGYSLLDYSDIHQLDSVGIYLVRQGLLLRWSMDEFIGTLTEGKANLATLREDFQEMTNSL